MYLIAEDTIIYLPRDSGSSEGMQLQVVKQDNVRIYIYKELTKHNEPHYHVVVNKNQYKTSNKIIDDEIIVGQIPIRLANKAKKLAEENRQKIIDTWNELHPNNQVKID